MGSGTTTRTIEITDADWVTTYDLDKRTGTRVSNPATLSREEYTRLSDSE